MIRGLASAKYVKRKSRPSEEASLHGYDLCPRAGSRSRVPECAR